MRIVTTLAVLALSLAVPPAARAAEAKIGFVNLQRAVTEVEEGKLAQEALKKEFDQKQKTLNDKQNELKKMKDDLDKQMVVMSDDAKREKAAEFERKVNDMQQMYVQMQKDLSDREREMMKGIFDKMEGIIKELAQKQGYAYVFEQQNAGLMVAPPSADMTNELIQQYNAKYKVAGAPAAKKADGKKPAAAPASK